MVGYISLSWTEVYPVFYYACLIYLIFPLNDWFLCVFTYNHVVPAAGAEARLSQEQMGECSFIFSSCGLVAPDKLETTTPTSLSLLHFTTKKCNHEWPHLNISHLPISITHGPKHRRLPIILLSIVMGVLPCWDSSALLPPLSFVILSKYWCLLTLWTMHINMI